MNPFKLLIKNILFFPFKVYFPMIFLLEDRMGGGKEWRSGLSGSPVVEPGNQALAPRRLPRPLAMVSQSCQGKNF